MTKRKTTSSKSPKQKAAWEYGQDLRLIRGVIANMKIIQKKLFVSIHPDLDGLLAELEKIARDKYVGNLIIAAVNEVEK